jgi:TolB-like protein/DNA-binding winged helix-turn-helix (wHTH) protein/Tfp pilus assembly protein PilF
MGEPKRVRFGRFEADLVTGELRRDGVRIHLQERPFQVLTALVLNAGELVSREELRRQLWGPDTFVDFDNSLNTAVTKIREALGDTAESHRFIETLPRRGYRFVAPVTIDRDAVENVAPGPAIEAAVSPAAHGEAARPPWLVAAGITAAVLALAVAGWLFLNPSSQRVPAARIVVLPFQNLSGDPTQDFLSDAFTEETIARLGRLYWADLGVIARTSSMHYKETRKRVDQIARELDVQYLVEGSVQREGDRVRVTAQLIRTADQSHLWANTYDRSVRDVLDIQREIVSSIADAVHARVSTADAPAGGLSTDTREDDWAARELYLKGRYLWNQRTGASVRAALNHFQQAIELQPGHARPYAGVADAYIILGSQGEMAIGESHAKARTAALKALELDDRVAEAHTSLAALVADYYWDWALAESHFTRALALNPNDATTHHWYSEYLVRVGRIDEALREAEAARRADPLSPIANVNLGHQLTRARRYADAIARHQQTLELFPDFGPAHSAIGFAYIHQGNAHAGVEHFERFREIVGETPDSVGLLGWARARSGDGAGARLALATLDRLATTRHVPSIDRAVIHLGLNDLDPAFSWLERALENREWQVAFLGTDPLYDPLRKDARFAQLVSRVGLPAPATGVPSARKGPS